LDILKPCRKCGSQKYYVAVDVRGVPEARCAECDCQIQKVSSKFLYDYYVERIASVYAEQEEKANEPKPEAPVCKYCTERWAILEGRMGVRPREMKDIKFCPMCGRELKEDDRKY